jgi:hypothetical protein
MVNMKHYNDDIRWKFGENARFFPSSGVLIAFQFCMWLSRQETKKWEWTGNRWVEERKSFDKDDMIYHCELLNIHRGGMMVGRDLALEQLFPTHKTPAPELPSPIDFGEAGVGCVDNSAASYFVESDWTEGYHPDGGLVKIADKRAKLV